jgi:hypothetical protein
LCQKSIEYGHVGIEEIRFVNRAYDPARIPLSPTIKMKKIIVTHSSDLNWKNEFYNCLKKFRSEDYEIFLPQEDGAREKITKEMIKDCDFVIAEVSFPSTGQGIELGWADINNKRINCVFKEGSKISNSLRFISDNFLSYTNMDNLSNEIRKMLGDK